LLKYAKGYRGRSKNCFTIAIRRVQKGWQYAYRDRRNKKRLWRTLWIQRIQAGVRQYHMNYSRFVRALYHYNPVVLNRKVLSELAATEPFTFKAIVDVVRYQQAQYDDTHLSHAAVTAVTKTKNTTTTSTTTVSTGTTEHEEDGDAQPLPSLETQEAA
jgi:large subunit ribosomal protein L20